MLERKYDPTQPYRYARYGRMSDPRQNKRSPDQQFNTIGETLARCSYPWQCVATYRDDGISGRYLRKRPGFQRLLRDIEAGLLTIDLLVVDTWERLGRADEIAELRRKLFVAYGVLIVAADNGFADPTGVVGKAVGMVEQIRSTENTRISRHNVLRGKKDAARRRRWPGGPPPFGFRLKPVVNEAVVPPEIYRILEIDPRQAASLRLAFERAAATGDGDLRLSQWWNTSPEIPDAFKPTSPFTMGYRLENPIAIGTLRWGEHRTGVVNDTRVIEPNPDGAELVPNFCTPLISVELYERVQHLRKRRADQIQQSRQPVTTEPGSGAKMIAPQTRGLALKFLLTGLVRCGCCQASMRPVPSGRRSQSGRRYVYYTCPRHYDGACPNGRHIPEEPLREAVIARVRARIFPLPPDAGPMPVWLAELLRMVRQEQQRIRADEPDRNAMHQEELRQLKQQLAGWSMTLGNPQLPAAVRGDIEARYAQGKQRQQELLEVVAARMALPGPSDGASDPKTLITALAALSGILAAYNPTFGNLELSKHIECISGYPDGRVEMRGTELGIFASARDGLRRGTDPELGEPPSPAGHRRVIPRRRGRLRIPNLAAGDTLLTGDSVPSTHSGNGGGWPETPVCWPEAPLIEENQSWSERHATEVARMRATGQTHDQLAAHFRVTVPTIRKALKRAAVAEPLLQLPAKIPRRRWAEDHAEEVLRLRNEGFAIQEIAQRLGKSDPTIRAALWEAQRKRNDGRPVPDPNDRPS